MAQQTEITVTDTLLTAPQTKTKNQPSKGRVWFIGGLQTGIWIGSFVALNQAWYKGYEKVDFHFFNDWPEWQQMDKAGHAWTSYQVSRLSTDMWRWTGIKNKNAIILGSVSSIAYLSIIEIQDGYSDKWGFSTGDMIMNIAGAGLYLSQEFGWKEQRLMIKFSYYPFTYDPAVQQRANDLFGTGAEKILKDYNAQTYWLSANLRSFFPDSKIPKWLNLSFGYGARTMLGGTENVWTNDDGTVTDRSDIPRYRRFLLSADVDLTRIPVKKKWLKTLFSVVNVVKIPAPAIEFNTQGKVVVYGMYF